MSYIHRSIGLRKYKLASLLSELNIYEHLLIRISSYKTVANLITKFTQ